MAFFPKLKDLKGLILPSGFVCECIEYSKMETHPGPLHLITPYTNVILLSHL